MFLVLYGGIDYRESMLALRELRKVALEKNINPDPEFLRISQSFSHEHPRGGSTPMSELMAG